MKIGKYMKKMTKGVTLQAIGSTVILTALGVLVSKAIEGLFCDTCETEHSHEHHHISDL